MPYQWRKGITMPSQMTLGGENVIKCSLGCLHLRTGDTMPCWVPFSGENVIDFPLGCPFYVFFVLLPLRQPESATAYS